MTIIDEYKERLIKVIETTYNGNINHDWIVNYVNNIVKQNGAEQKELTAHCRNLFRYQYDIIKDPNLIPVEVEKEKYNVLANGLFTYPTDPANKKILIKWGNERDYHKQQMLLAVEAGDLMKVKDEDRKQYKKKANSNAVYGASLMPKGWCGNLDMGGAITAQARNFISEQVWCIERFLGSNFSFYNINELMLYITKLFEMKSEIFNEENLKFITYIPTVDDCLKRFISITKDIEGFRKKSKRMQKSTFLMFEMMNDEWKRIAFYYSNNPIELIARNEIPYKLMENIINADVDFTNPYLLNKLSGKTKDEIINILTDPNGKNKMSLVEAENMYVLYDSLMKLLDIINIFSYSNIIIGERVYKYFYKHRKVCVIGDTDSTMPSFHKFVKDVFNIYNKPELMKDEKTQIRLMMSVVFITTDLLDKCCLNYVHKTNSWHGPKFGQEFFMKMKNEFFFPIVVLFPGKKNYIGIKTIQEGKMIPEKNQLSITGAALGASGINEYVSESVLKLLTDVVLKSEKYDPLSLVRGVHQIEDHISTSIKNGDKSFGVFKRYSGTSGIKDPERTATVRAACIWNELYPDDYIVPGDAVYEFDTNLLTEADLDKMDPKYSEIREKIRNIVFKPRGGIMDYSRFGLKTFAVPADGDTVSIPKWIIPFINVQSAVEKHLKPMTTLYSSLLLSPSTYRVNGTKKLGTSTLIRW